ncbi:hypothetical protein B7494_g6118 [Chlorociboria aeruginascens]|nr:hypothetical protein B7494_g6118 [Chlorociboria aeruginascens]
MLSIPNKNIISRGSSRLISPLPSGHVLKSPYPGSDDYNRNLSLRDILPEFQIYQRLPPHDRILQMINYSPEEGIVLEHMPNGNLREYLQSPQSYGLTLAQWLQWASNAAEGLQLLHSYGIIHCDVKPENFLLDAGLCLRLIDFSRSSLDWNSTVVPDSFALGSNLYEIMTNRQPYRDRADDEVEALFKQQDFPSTDEILCGEEIQGFWHSKFESAEETLVLIKIEMQRHSIKFGFGPAS